MKSFYEFQKMMEQNPATPATANPSPSAGAASAASQNLAAGAGLVPVDPTVQKMAATLGTNRPVTNTLLNMVKGIKNAATRNAYFNLFKAATTAKAPATGTTQTQTQAPLAAGGGMTAGVSPNAATNAQR